VKSNELAALEHLHMIIGDDDESEKISWGKKFIFTLEIKINQKTKREEVK